MTGVSPIMVRAHFDRFPATVKGAFVIRGQDPDPHQVVFKSARAVAVGGRVDRPLQMAPATIDVPPKRDIFIPFELSVSDMDPGWYELECELEIDGIAGTFPGGKRFVVGWPRSSIRRGQLPVGRDIALEDDRVVHIEQVECGGDSIKVHLIGDPSAVRLDVDGDLLEVLDTHFDESTGRGRIVAYPLPRTSRVLRIGPARARRGSGASIDIDLA